MPKAPEPFVRVPPEFANDFPDGDRLATEVFLNIGMLTGGVRAAVTQLLAREGLTSMGAFNVLTVVHGDPRPLPPSVIAERMMVTRPTITGLLDSLERRGLLIRGAGAEDGRQRAVRLTRKGRHVVNRLLPQIHRFERDLLGCLSKRELLELHRSVAKLQHRLTALAPHAALGI